MTQVSLLVDTDLQELGLNLAWQADHKTLMKFILAIDENVCDYDFTKKLAKKLTKLYKAEETTRAAGERLGY